MATITYKVIQKPFEQRVIDAACVYWGVERGYFSKASEKENSTVVYRKSIVYYLIKNGTTYSLKEIANMFGFVSHGHVSILCDKVDSTKSILKQVRNDLNQIQFLSDKLDADFISTDIKLINNKIEKTDGLHANSI